MTSANTSINKNKVPAIFKKIKYETNTKLLDYGAGKYTTQVDYLKEQGVQCFRYDPYNLSEDINQEGLSNGPYDYITLSNVLNVVASIKERLDIIKNCLALLKSNGELYISIYEGDKSEVGRETKKDCWQNNQRLDFYFNEITYSGFRGITIYKKYNNIIIKKH